MITARSSAAGLLTIGGEESDLLQSLWIDLLHPTAEEVERVERLAAIHIPPHEKMQEIEASSRLFHRGDALVATVPVLTGSSGLEPRNAAVTFIFTGRRLVTVRYDSPQAFNAYADWLSQSGTHPSTAGEILLGLMEAMIDRIADVLETLVADLDKASHRIFHQHGKASRRRASSRELETLLRTIGRAGDLSSRARETILGIKRMAAFVPHADAALGVDGAMARLETIGHDLQSLAEHIDFMSHKITFLLDATLGMISIQQNQIIKLFTIMSVLFLPPTLVASWYGMNFKIMPELQWEFGYAYAIALAVLAALVPYWLFKRKGWM